MSELPMMRYVARVTIESKTPFLVGSGRGSEITDMMPVVDANGLPAIPGTSIAGVLRHGFAAHPGHSDGATRDLFGFASRKDSKDEGRGSKLWVSWAHIHDQSDTPVDGFRPEGIGDDPVLQNALALSVRDHVRINHRGAAADRGKFDQAVIPAGHRFTFDMILEGSASGDDEAHFDWLLGYLASPSMRIGGSGKRGLGAFDRNRVLYGAFDLTQTDQALRFAGLPVRLDAPAPELVPYNLQPDEQTPLSRTLELELQAEDYWVFCGEEAWLTEKEQSATDAGSQKTPDFNPVREERVVWRDGRGHVAPPAMYIPGSA
ncbi:MAG: hypothetical protein GF355_04840, partial [Candidatus Eisenbacteria bacterium]|nr:hypothetical protein [Candidatus Latescibacterota bacterium]MBD3334820.1 hypothetical protein [Candidatus Eisenbacteria bacterium]